MIDFDNPIEMLRAENPTLVSISLVEICENPVDDSEVIDLVKSLLCDTRFAQVGYPGSWAPIRLVAGFALASIHLMQKNKTPVMIHDSTWIIHENQREIWEVVTQFQKTSNDALENASNRLKALQIAFENGKLATQNYSIAPEDVFKVAVARVGREFGRENI